MRRLGAVCAALLVVAGCNNDAPAVSGQTFVRPGTTAWHRVVPSDALPAGVAADLSNNNLDILLYQGRLWFAFRTAPTHFASTETTMYLLSTDDVEGLRDWRLETTVHTGKDIREPRLFVVDDRLFFYFSELGTELTSFDPDGVKGMVRADDGSWSEPVTIFADARVVWRIKELDGRVWMTSYRGTSKVFEELDPFVPIDVMFSTTDDGWTWRGVDGGDEVVLRAAGLSEVGFASAPAGALFSVIRAENADPRGFGSRLCQAPPGDWKTWRCRERNDPHKYDSPLMFRYRDRLYLIARYNPAGAYDLAPGEPVTVERWWRNLWNYSATTKRTALYAYDTERWEIRLLDVWPTNGDTAFASAVWLDNDRLFVFNYSSDPSAPEMSWIEGQLTGSQIYAAVLDFGAGTPTVGVPVP
ncbi:MAG: hypothetical protein D6761_10615 [Candidatus Dadabacteria bacterium]|nr:MAG: hypothetical protein D6761_10615 [Candidatus Dadabacteria bacterium]